MAKMNVSLTLTKDYRKNERFHPKKQTQFKPNFFKAQNERKRFFTKGL
jgi:hypothetical protein